MQMIVLIVFAVVLSFGAPDGPRIAQLSWPALIAAAHAYVAGAAAMTWVLTRGGLRRLMAANAFAATVQRQRRRLMAVGVWLVGGMVALVASGATDRLGELPGVAVVPLADEILILGVFFGAIVAHWRISFRFDRAVRWQVEQDLMTAGLPVRAGWNAGEHLDYNIRHHFLFVAVPVGLIVFVHELVDLLMPGSPPLAMAVKAAGVGAAFFMTPALLIHVWRTRPMPDGELRRRLERLCGKINLKYRRILIWDTGGVIANAGVMGLHRSVRYILISDALLEQMDDRQIVAVFGHEAGHVKHHHIAYFLLFIVAAMVACMALVSAGGMAAERILSDDRWVGLGEEVAMGVLVVVTILFGFGWLSRRLERQADVYAAWCAGLDAEIEGAPGRSPSDLGIGGPWFIAALESIARLNGMSRRGRNWRHGSIAMRVQFLADWIGGGRNRREFDRGVTAVKWIGWLIALVAIIGAAATWPRWW